MSVKERKFSINIEKIDEKNSSNIIFDYNLRPNVLIGNDMFPGKIISDGANGLSKGSALAIAILDSDTKPANIIKGIQIELRDGPIKTLCTGILDIVIE
ncbi:hypothetical protein E4V01_25125 [Methylorubrum sp. Q1]|uniref:hypothetical protein n=1 Tax=Methylorubrum sp. Q1 TaxID=2562453 RepID=UPI001076779C|nr:hypothetical protein [Methylorubrum sp. Q1]TFZ54495.1 hypothetical protein E4V01_25125 [Methylorubrum sp. Q1]